MTALVEIATKTHRTVKIMTIFSLTRDFNFSMFFFVFLSLSFSRFLGSLNRYLSSEKVSNERDDTNNEKHDYINSVHKLLQTIVSFLCHSLSLCHAF